MKYFLISFFSIICLFLLFSCEDGDNFSSDPNLKVEFSNDTIRFDTVFTSFGSSTRRLKVYNRNNSSINISSIELMNPEKTGFRMNVDGFAGNKVNNVDLLKKDSLFIFIEITVDPLNSESSLFISDSIKFNINGSTQYVHLEAVGQDAEVWTGGRIIEHDTTLVAGKPLLIFDSIYIKKNATLNIDKNVKLHFHDKAKIIVDGRINAKGTLEEPVVFRADRYDHILTNVPYDNIQGQWDGMIVDSASYNNHFEYVQFRNTTDGITFKRSDTNTKKMTFINSKIHNSNGNGIYAEECWIEAQNSLFTNARGYVLKFVGGKYDFTHCTIANHLSWSITRKDKALSLSNSIKDENKNVELRPLISANFTNSIISGTSRPEYVIDKNQNERIFYSFKNCVIYAREVTDDTEKLNFPNTIWAEAKFKYTNNENRDYFYNFELDSISPAKNMADVVTASAIPFDIRGVSRMSDEGPDIGCYEWVATEEDINSLSIRK